MSEIEIRNLTKKIKDRIILNGLNLTFPTHGLFVIEGDNGAGKSTLLGILGMFDNRFIGMYKYRGLDAAKLSYFSKLKIRKDSICFLAAQGNLFRDLSVIDNLNYVGGSNKSYNFLKDIDFSSRVSGLSSGEEQLVSIARCLKQNKELNLLDEVTSFLDDEKTEQVMYLLKKMSETRLIIFASHDERIIPYGDRLLHMERGHLHD